MQTHAHFHLTLFFALAATMLTAPSALAQPPQAASSVTSLPAFDVISVKPNKTTPNGAYGLVTTQFTADGFSATNVPVHLLLQQAYGLREGQIVDEPAWVKTEAFNIEAKVAAPDVAAFSKLSADQREAMFQQILAERFQLAAHRDTRELPVYALAIAKGGAKLRESPPDPEHPGAKSGGRVGMSMGRIVAQRTTVADLASMLSRQLGRTVIDQTGLSSCYDFTLLWTPDGVASNGSASAPSDAPPSIFTAVQEQLGLRLETTKAPIPVLVIESIQKPSEN
jgi:uncharacterized protein (TIGR03435 family)